jgi:O-antigen ligase
MRGGLALQEQRHREGVADSPVQQSQKLPRERARLSLLRGVASRVLQQRSEGDDQVWRQGSFQNVRWSLSLIGFLVYIFVAVTYQLGIGDVGVGLALVGLLFLGQPLRFPWIVVGLAALYGWGWVTYATSSYPNIVSAELVTLGKLVLITFVAVNVVRSRAEIRLYVILFLLFYAAYPARGTIFNYLGGYTHFGRALWNFIYANSNDLAAITLLVLSMATGVLVTERNRWFRMGAFAAVIVLTVIILLTKSRGVFLGLGFFAVFALLPQMKKLRNVGVAAVIVAGILLLAPSDVFERMGGLRHATDAGKLAEVDEEGSAQQRFAIWRVSWAIIASNPTTGVGWGAYPIAHGLYSERVDPTGVSRGNKDTHSTYFNLAAEMGFPGLFIFLGLVGGTLFYAEGARRRCRMLLPRTSQQLFYLQLGLLGFLVAAVFASYSRISFLYLHLALMYCIARACNEDMKRLTVSRYATGRGGNAASRLGGARHKGGHAPSDQVVA